MTDKYLIIFTDKETGKYDHFDLYPKEIATEEEILQRVNLWNENENNNLIATYHNNDVFSDFVEDIENVTQSKKIITCLKSIVSSIHTNICELESWTDDIRELFED
jgi:hypothetical protein